MDTWPFTTNIKKKLFQKKEIVMEEEVADGNLSFPCSMIANWPKEEAMEKQEGHLVIDFFS